MIEFRRKQGLLQRDFANKVGFPPHVLSHLERGNTEWALSRIEQVCEAFNLPLSYFFFDSKSVKTKEEVALRVMEMSDEKWEAAQNSFNSLSMLIKSQ
jgi:transcriptional regulator with XRE-family HTH domain